MDSALMGRAMCGGSIGGGSWGVMEGFLGT